MARGNRDEKPAELPESYTGRFARKILETYLNHGLDQIEESLETADHAGPISLALASVLLQNEDLESEVWDHWLRMEYLEAVHEAVSQSLEALNGRTFSWHCTSQTRH